MKKVLLIEDDQVIRENTAEILELAMFDVVTAVDGREGSYLAKKVNPDIILCDIMMPVLDGYGVINILSKDPTTSDIPFLFLTAKGSKADVRKGMELGADDYLPKPYEDTDLLAAIDARLKKKRKSKLANVATVGDVVGVSAQDNMINDINSLLKNRPVSTYKKKEVVFHAGDIPQYLYYLVKGKVKIYKTHDDGKEYIMNILKDGEFFGMPVLFENRAYSCSAIVLENSEICKISKEDFLALVYQNQEAAKKFIKLLTGHIQLQENQLISLAYDTVRKRTAEALLMLQKRYGQTNEIGTVISVAREDLAGIAGTATETVIRCLSEFKEDKYIQVKGREITIVNSQGLRRIQ